MFGLCNSLTRVTKHYYIFFPVCFVLILSFQFCNTSQKKDPEDSINKNESLYLNHADSAKYVGMATCKLCHQDIYNTFIKTGMGKSLGIASQEKSSANFSNATIYDKFSNMQYNAFWKKDSLFIKELRVEKNDTIHLRTEKVNYIIGSGQHTNSHLQSLNGYIHQMPMTFYTQKQKWDLPPGFENGFNTHFNRKIGLECMSCHNGYPDFVLGSENKYQSIPSGIDCERCHGPGSIHVAERQTGLKVDTSKFIDYTIVNPAKLSIDRQFDICQRCHLQGNAVLKEGKSFYDFKPGQKLSDFISVFLPKYKNADDEFIMASHADRLKQSACFIKSSEIAARKNSLKPYRDGLTCVTCHNPHVSVRETNKNVFNDACVNCHNVSGMTKLECTDKNVVTEKKSLAKNSLSKLTNCVGCHMPVSGSTDIPHVSVHDHYIRKPITEKQKNKIKTFIGLFSVNEKKPDSLTKAIAYINQYDKFNQDASYLDSATALLKDKKLSDLILNIRALIQLNFTKQDFGKVIKYVLQIGEQRCFNELFIKQSFDNIDAWACYRIAESYYYSNNVIGSVKWFKKAVNLAPYNLDFRNKLATALASLNNLEEAEQQLKFVISENSKHVSALNNLGYLKLKQGLHTEAFKLYKTALQFEPDNEPLLLNLAGYYALMKNKNEAKKYLEIILKNNPKCQKAKMAMQQINRLL